MALNFPFNIRKRIICITFLLLPRCTTLFTLFFLLTLNNLTENYWKPQFMYMGYVLANNGMNEWVCENECK